MIPLSDDPGPRRRFPIVNYALILANIVVFVYEVAQGNLEQCFQVAYSAVPYAITHGQTVATGCPISEPSPVYLTLITSMFLHANLLHIAGNMLYLWIFGDNVEDALGHIPYLLFYLFCGLVANIAQIAIAPNSLVPSLGASGAIAGVLGAYVVFYPAAKVRTLIFLGIFVTLARLSAIIVIGLWFVYQLVEVFLSYNQAADAGVAYMAHVGGFLAGLIIAILLKPRVMPKPPYPQSYPYWPVHQDLRDRSYPTY
jgi:membrane associated rhomboid family serine protease